MKKWYLCLVIILLAAWGVWPQAQATELVDIVIVEEAHVGYPTFIGALGDSITQAVNADGLLENAGEQPQYAWITGTDAQVQSHATRIITAGGVVTSTNIAVPGADSNDLMPQVMALDGGTDYITLLIGGNDACTSTEAEMTSVDQFRLNIEQALTTIAADHPNARIYVVSIPNIYQLWDVLKDNPSARFVWDVANICQSMLANPQSTDQADVERRARVLQRVVDYNTVLAEACVVLLHCRFDDNAIFNTEFMASDVSSLDYFHPSIAGQAKIAAISYEAGFDFTDAQAPQTSVVLTETAPMLEVSLVATDNVAVRGIEYQLNSSGWMVYTNTLALQLDDTLVFRAVDVNGNSEAARSFTWQGAETQAVYLPTLLR